MAEQGLADYIITDHAAGEMARRRISSDDARAVVEKPEQRILVRPGRVVFQSIVGRGHLLRVTVDIDGSRPKL